MSDDHWQAALAMILDYRKNGERNAAFTAMCREIAKQRLARAEADADRQDRADA